MLASEIEAARSRVDSTLCTHIEIPLGSLKRVDLRGRKGRFLRDSGIRRSGIKVKPDCRTEQAGVESQEAPRIVRPLANF